ncbi:dihydrofolate reductase [Acholeplasma equifetale]|uniref:dihydrofolate reductase n=1 Tax=Acholeplasma equifetale TaxID=264634 RepID=UPI00047B4EDE|nr:dihydrofolate reductase [Acholeplasma equifetale]HHY96558.1 dihydrofolate reductase [Acholeplasma sp.]
MIRLIWAMDSNWLIGKDNILPWHFKEDLVYFKEKTKNQTVLMGDLTYQSLKGYYKDKPFPYGKIYVANLVDKVYSDAICVKDVVSFVKNLKEDIWVIGGKSIYQLTLPYADELYITHVLGIYEGNVYFPSFKLSDYKLKEKTMSNQLIFAVYQRK